ncbi:dipeptide epimerase [Deinococcus lacus]|uniref:Dipeptide epimerase n=1 Tax=Deinococcus lacus TaxID=392561 RepID=A0ABW1Y9K1_9DEIO
MIRWTELELQTRRPFGIARWTAPSYPRTIVTLRRGAVGRGEAAPNAFYGETGATVQAVLPLLSDLDLDPWDWDGLHRSLEARMPGFHPSVKCALEMAFVEHCAVSAGLPVWRLLGLSALELPQSSYTVSLGDNMAQDAQDAAARGYQILKLKLGQGEARDRANLAAVRHAAPDVTLRVDANAAWGRAEARRMLPLLEEAGVELLEQPLAAGDLEGHAELRRLTAVPLVADESLHAVQDIPALAGAFDGVNLKLAKLGGPLQALRAARLARAHRLQLMMGCMVETSLGIAAAAHLAGLCDWADLDGALLLSDDPFTGLVWTAGQLRRPEGVGWGVQPLDASLIEEVEG